MEQFGFVCVMSSEQTDIAAANSSSSSSCTNSLQLEDAIAVIRDIAAAEEGQSGYLPSEQAFVPADLMASEEDNDNTSQDFTSTSLSGQKLYIWDLNGVLIPHIDQIDNSPVEDQHPGRVRDMVMKALRVISENSFFQKDLEAASLTTIDDHSMDDSGQDLSSYDFSSDGFTSACGLARKKSDMSSKEWNRKLAFRCRRIKDIYTRHSASLTELLQSLDGDEDWNNLTTGITSVTDHWPSKVISCLTLIQSRQDSSSIIISKEPLISMISKTVVFGLAPYTPITSHYSTTKLGVDKCLKQITDRYGAGCTFIILSNNPERIELAVKNNNYASWPLSNVSDLCSLQTMLQLGHL
ncbi:eyes absent homolog 3-like isoform X2 [Dysidea avara]|uniref:eyes absent homolog 3-like isoform X2 n=1 Tax=Dysidea avara TaxID=196820 RepID=UPI0033195FC1